MKTLEQLLQQEPVYLNDWSNKIDMISDFEGLYMSKKDYEAEIAPYANVEYWEENKTKMKKAIDSYNDINVLFASYGQANYSGDAWVLFEKDNRLYEVNGGHCSCYGLEGQWEPEETDTSALRLRIEKGNLGQDAWSGNEFLHELKEFIGL